MASITAASKQQSMHAAINAAWEELPTYYAMKGGQVYPVRSKYRHVSAAPKPGFYIAELSPSGTVARLTPSSLVPLQLIQ